MSEDIRAAATAALQHVLELEDAWQRGAIHEIDGNGGTRSNRNVEVRSRLELALAGSADDGAVSDAGERRDENCGALAMAKDCRECVI